MNPISSLFSALWSRARGRKLPWDAVAISALTHLILLLGAGFLTVLVVQGRQKMMFEGKKNPSIAARKLEHSIRVKQVQKQSRKPQILQHLVAKAPGVVALPEMPRLQAPDVKSMRDSPLLDSRAGGALGGLGGAGGGAGRGLTGGSGYSDTKFFGENVRTRAICILMDISASMVAKGVLEDVRRESKTMLEGLSPVTKFNIIVFVDGAEAFTPQMVFATETNKAAGLRWLDRDFDTTKRGNWSIGNRRGFSGSTPSQAIEMAVEMGCDTLFVLTDDPPYLKEGDRTTGVEITDHPDQIMDHARGIESRLGRQVRINTICYKPFSNERGQRGIAFYRKLAQVTGGRFKLIKAE